MSNQASLDKSIQIDSKKNLNLKNENKIVPENGSTRNIITKEEAVYLSKVSISTDAELIGYSLKPYSEEKIGFFGDHQELILEVRKPDSPINVKKSLFVKSIPYNVPFQAAVALEKKAFAKEVEFFREIEPLMRQEYKGESWIPTCYLAKDDTLVWEDMKLKGFTNRSTMLDEESLMSAVACIARFHVSSLLAEDRLDGKSFKEVYPNAFEESEYTNTDRRLSWFTAAINYAVSVAEDLGLETNHIFEASKRVFDIALHSKEKRNVVTHGDLWSSNILFDEDNNCRLVDFQLLRYAPPGQDIMQLLYLCTSRKFREEREADVLEHYYTKFKETLVIHNFTGVIPSFDEIKQGAYEQKFPTLVAAVIYFPTIMIDGKIGADIMNKPNSYGDYFFHDRKPIADQVIAMDAEYERKIQEIVRELVEVSYKVDDFPRVT